MLRRSQLYVPGNNEKMIAKSSSLVADSVVLDLEDAVPENQKDQGRELVLKLSRELDWQSRELCVRINPRGTKHFQKDVSSIANCRRVDSVLIPKAEGDCTAIHAKSRKMLIPIIETAEGLLDIRRVVASRGAVAVSYGAADFAASVGGSISSYLDNATVKTLVAAAAGAFHLDAIDSVFFDLSDMKGFRNQAVTARGLGYVGKQVIHPSQVKVANEVFSPTKEELEWARRVVREMGRASAAARGAITVNGKLVDAVHVRIAQKILERSS